MKLTQNYKVGVLVLVVLSQSAYFTVSITADTNVPHLSHTRYSTKLPSNVCGIGSAIGLLRKPVEIIYAEIERQ